MPEQRRRQLWLVVRLTNLALDALALSAVGPAAVVEPLRGQIRVVAVNEKARLAGIEPGNKLTTALALERSLQVLDRSELAERATLESVAAWTDRLTPRVVLEFPESVLMEVSGSLKLFRGLTSIKACLSTELEARQLAFYTCTAPTALGALWLARGGGEDVVVAEELIGRLSRLPLWVTRWPEPTQAMLRESGARTVGDCLRLPRDGFARRAGRQFLADLDKAAGLRFDSRASFQAPRYWQTTIEFPEEVADSEVLADAIEHALDDLADDLRKRQSQVPRLQLTFIHAHRPSTVESFELTSPSHERERLSILLLDRLERTVLPAPVLALRFDAGPLEPMSLHEPSLFEKRCAATSAQTLLERLLGRFGDVGVYGVETLAEYRPECAWMRKPPASAGSCGEASPSWVGGRPLWVLPAPLPLASAAARRYYEGSVQLQSGPERIESGWWNGVDVRRDYYTAASSCGQRLWVYRDRVDRAWHLHGMFG